MSLDLIAGRRRTGAVVNMAAAGNANAVIVYPVSNFANQVGAKSFRLRRLKIRSNAVGADTWVHIGTGAAGAVVDVIPALRIVNNVTDDYEEFDLPTVECAVDLMAYPDAVGAGSLDISAEVEEIG